jgi:periplasmic divalent cation tolerance protein
MGAVVVVTTVGDEEQALLIAREMVARRLAACVNVLPGIRSVYRWQGKICQDGEYLLLIKTLAEEYEAVAAAIRELHSYELPEILAFPVEQGDARFFAWIRDSLDKSAAFDEDEDEDDVEADEDHEGDDRDEDDLGVAVARRDERGEP